MNTHSHLLITAGLAKFLNRDRSIPSRPFCLGAVLPDLALILLSLGYAAWFRYGLNWPRRAIFRHLFDELYFYDPIWMIGHNLLHAPLLLGTGMLLSRSFGWRRLYWFLCGCLLHSVLDILTHVDDGPLLLFPLDWRLRFASPVSYWDSRHYGDIFSRFALILDLALLLWLLLPPVLRRLRAHHPKAPRV